MVTSPRLNATDPIVRQLRAIAQEAPDLEQAAGVYEIILPLLRDTDLRVEPLALTPAEARARLERGLPLLQDLDLALNEQAACGLLMRLACTLETQGPPTSNPKHDRATAARRIRLALEQDRLPMAELLPRVAAEDSAFVTILAERLQLDPALLWTLGQNALKPALRAWAEQLTPLASGSGWGHGYCFVCGACPTLGELQGGEQIKHLRCGRCGSDWEFRRAQCIYCGNDDHNTLGFYYPEGQRETRRLEVCDVCHGYLKVIAAFSSTPPDLLPVQDLATLHLDYIAQERGYTRAPERYA